MAETWPTEKKAFVSMCSTCVLIVDTLIAVTCANHDELKTHVVRKIRLQIHNTNLLNLSFAGWFL